MQAIDMIGTVAHRQTVYCMASGGVLPVTVTIATTTYLTTADFSLFGTAYTFSPSKWSGKGFTPFLCRFHEGNTRDISQFGAVLQNSEGTPTVQMDASQKYNTVVQVVCVC